MTNSLTPPPVFDRYDLIIVGSGIAGLYAALLAAPQKRVLLVTKGALEESNTRYAQGGIAVALHPQDSPELHLRDTIVAGDGLCNPQSVAILTSEAPDCIRDLLRRGVPFDRDGGELAWTREAAHSLPRVLHAGGDATGASIERTLSGAVRAAGVTIQEHTLCSALLTEGDRTVGIEILTADNTLKRVPATDVILATGGAGQLFARTTNPTVATGDGLAIAYRAGADLMDMEFMQFHPTALVIDGAPSFLISEAVRGEGGILRDRTGYAFMTEYHPDGELAPRDVVARAIHQQMMLTDSDHVGLDMTHLAPDLIERRFPTIVQFCREYGIDPIGESIPVAPAAHYLMGGIRTDMHGRGSLPGLFAVGEVACTGVHGANRLASNSLLEGLVFARRAVESILAGNHGSQLGRSAAETAAALDNYNWKPGSRRRLADAMWKHASLVRSAESLNAARAAIANEMQPVTLGRPRTREEYEMSNLALVANLLITSATLRLESRGAHFRSDFPDRDVAWLQRTVLSHHETRYVSAGHPGAGVLPQR